MVRECQSKLNTLGGNNDIQLHWVRGHSGEEGNERADELAKLGSSTPYIGAELAVGVSPTIIKSMISNVCQVIHDDLWFSQDSCWQTKSLAPGRNEKYAHSILRLPRKQLRTLLCLITGHGGFKNHLHRMGLTLDRACPLCEEELDTSSHFLCRCPALQRARLVTLGDCRLNSNCIRSAKIADLLDFVRKSGRADEIAGLA